MNDLQSTSFEHSSEGLPALRRGFCGPAIAAFAALMPAVASAQISIYLENLPPHAVTQRELSVTAVVSSDEEIVSVRAQVDSDIIELERDPLAIDVWYGTVQLSGGFGTRTLTVTATGISGAQATASDRFPYYPEPPEPYPGLVVLSPTAGAVARPTIEVAATFDRVAYPYDAYAYVVYVPAPGQTWDSLDFLPVSISEEDGPYWTWGVWGVVDLSAYAPSSGSLVFIAVGSSGQLAEVWVPIEVRSAPDFPDAGTESDAGMEIDAGMEGDASVDASLPSDAAADAEGPLIDGGDPSSDAGDTTDDAGACADGGTSHGWKPHHGHHHHGWRWPSAWRRFHCSASPQPSVTPRTAPVWVISSIVLFLVHRRRDRARRPGSGS